MGQPEMSENANATTIMSKVDGTKRYVLIIASAIAAIAVICASVYFVAKVMHKKRAQVLEVA